jgi:hypothetical protein
MSFKTLHHGAALDAVRWEVATKFHPAKFRSQAAPRVRVGEPWIDSAELPRFGAAFAAGGSEGLAQAIPPSWIEGLTASGTPDEVVQRVERYREAGVTLPILRPATRHRPRASSTCSRRDDRSVARDFASTWAIQVAESMASVP